MKIQIFYYEGCPNHKPAVKRVREVLCDEGMSAELVEVNVSDASIAHDLGFLGSPSIRVNGVDVEPGARSARDYGIMWRTYAVNGRREGLPSLEMLIQAIRGANAGVTDGSACFCNS